MKEKEYLEEVADRIRAARLVAGLSQAVMSRTLGLSRTVLSRIENGLQSPTLAQVEAISEITNVNYEHLVLGSRPLQQALDQIDDIQRMYNIQAEQIDRLLNEQLRDMRASYIDRYGFPEQDYPIKN